MVQKFDVFEYGCVVDGRIMDNGERRIRMRVPDGSAYIYTKAV